VGTGRRAAGTFLPGLAQVHPCNARAPTSMSAHGPGRKVPTSRLDIVQDTKLGGFDW